MPNHPVSHSRKRKSSSSRSSKSRSSSKSNSARWRDASKEQKQASFSTSFTSRLAPTGKRPLRFREKLALYAILFGCIAAIVTGVMAYHSQTKSDLEWKDYTQLPPVHRAPAMVSSEAPVGSEQYIEPFMARGHAIYVIEKLEELLRTDQRFRYVRRISSQLQAVAIAPPFGFEDDLVFQARNNPERVEVSSSSRVGPNDFGGNRKRLEELRETLRELLVVK
ncbi:MAG: DUF1499 domain-containing protein [Puniceicoccales bacterium]